MYGTSRSGISSAEGGDDEYGLQICGTVIELDAKMHIGALVECSGCTLQFKLLPKL